METSKKATALLCRILSVLLLGCILFGSITLAIVSGDATFDDTYQSVIQRKYAKLASVEGPKIVIVGGSNAGFGIDAELMEESLGIPVVNMGLHAGFGQLFNTEIAKSHIREGDILILAYEYGLSSASFEKLGDIDLIMEGIDNRLELYREIPIKNAPEIFSNLFTYAKNKAQKSKKEVGVYASASFDDRGNMTLERNGFIIKDYENNIDVYGKFIGKSLLPPDDDFAYLQKLKKDMEKRGASIYFTSPVLLADAYDGTEQDMLQYAADMEAITGIPFISNPFNYVFPREYMFDTVYHCNEMGEQKRTELLIQDIRNKKIVA